MSTFTVHPIVRAARLAVSRAARTWRLVRRRWSMWQHPSSGRLA